jgi:hypothetical protein
MQLSSRSSSSIQETLGSIRNVHVHTHTHTHTHTHKRRGHTKLRTLGIGGGRCHQAGHVQEVLSELVPFLIALS